MAKKSSFGLSEAFLNAGADMMGNIIEDRKQKIRDFLKTQEVRKYTFHLCDGCLPDVFVDIEGNILLKKEDIDKGHIPFQFGKVSGSFICNDCGLTSLYNSPTEVGDNFCCSGNELESLIGCPQKVGISFECEANKVEFNEEDIKQVCKVGWKVNLLLLSPLRCLRLDLMIIRQKQKQTSSDIQLLMVEE